MYNILVLNGSIKADSSNGRLIAWLQQQPVTTQAAGSATVINWTFFEIGTLPFFNPAMDSVSQAPSKDQYSREANSDLPPAVVEFRTQLAAADGLLICTPEYVFSLPGVLKNALEWLVSTTLLTDKPTALITAAASGEKAQQQLHLLMLTLGARFTENTTLLIKGIAGKMQPDGELNDPVTKDKVQQLFTAFFASMLQINQRVF